MRCHFMRNKGIRDFCGDGESVIEGVGKWNEAAPTDLVVFVETFTIGGWFWLSARSCDDDSGVWIGVESAFLQMIYAYVGRKSVGILIQQSMLCLDNLCSNGATRAKPTPCRNCDPC